MDSVRSGRERERRGEQGQALLEAALAFPLLLMAAIGLVQFALFYHAQTVVTGAVQDGARRAAEVDATVGQGIGRTRALLEAGLGRSAGTVSVSGADLGNVTVIWAQGRLPTIVPWVADASLPLSAQAAVSKERFRAGPGW